MQSVSEFFQWLGDFTGTGPLSADTDGHLSVPLDDGRVLDIRRFDDTTVDIAILLDIFPDLFDAADLRTLLAANYLGVGSGAGRIGLDGDDVILCDRLVVTELDAGTAEARIEALVNRADYWASTDAAQMFVRQPDIGDNFIRV